MSQNTAHSQFGGKSPAPFLHYTKLMSILKTQQRHKRRGQSSHWKEAEGEAANSIQKNRTNFKSPRIGHDVGITEDA